jgi:predicted RNase H-related nuclease YkuK (DUF458 family)
MKDYKKFGGELIGDLGEYARNYISKNPDVVLCVGTDSKQLRKRTLYATAICFQHPGKGVHVVFKRENFPKIRDMFTRLWKEGELSLAVSEYLEGELKGVYNRKLTNPERDRGLELVSGMKLADIHLDFNPSKNHKSNMVYEAAVGMIKGYGYRVYTKQDPESDVPNAWGATCAADLLCK